MSRKDTVNSLFMRKAEPAVASPAVSKNPERVRTGAISAMGTSLQEMSEGARSAARLQEQLASGNVVIEIEPSAISDSSVGDRIPIDVDPNFDELVSSIQQYGQQVPVLVRPQADHAGRYEIAYGRRRLRAAEKLSLKVRAVVQALSDEDLVIAQGKENLDRQDLSFIEKALFALRLEDAGYKRETIIAALSTDKSDLSRYIAVARSLPSEIIQAIGPAPKAGRSRWVALADTLPASRKKLDSAIGEPEFATLPSDERFARALAAAVPKKKKAASGEQWKNAKGQKAAKIERLGKTTRLTFDERVVPEFAAFVTTRLEELHAEFEKTRNG
ncbi:plasmid partitioning protein RepB [Rhizobium leguminosarum]|uniref:plasmid partitioning protein RepB n=1 Tax=Rhizobium leguminosarum TaxID=384 RepID=UPI001AE4F4BF|nr:plasmid partitioning protein RepB [Rhizobium leguminosarum]MBP2449710.1 ParB family chromosome partitioning protein [Rhizobium leguminosarum]